RHVWPTDSESRSALRADERYDRDTDAASDECPAVSSVSRLREKSRRSACGEQPDAGRYDRRGISVGLFASARRGGARYWPRLVCRKRKFPPASSRRLVVGFAEHARIHVQGLVD